MKVCLQAGHGGITTGATGAPGERDWTTKIVPMIAERLEKAGVETYTTGSKANEDQKVTNTDWDMFLAVHYDADVYNDRGGFVDYPDASIDAVYEESKRLAWALRDHYFSTTGIPEKYSRSNANTKFYYMWSALTAKTPCVIIECGVGWRKPEDYEVLRNYDLIADTISDGILMGLGLYNACEKKLAECETKCQELDDELDDMRDSRDKWRESSKEWQSKYETEVPALQAKIGVLEGDLSFEKDKNSQLQEQLTTANETIARQKLSIVALGKEVDDLSAKLDKCKKTAITQYTKAQLLKWILFNKL